MRNHLENRLKRQRAELDSIERDQTILNVRKEVCKALIAELELLLRNAPKEGGENHPVERQLRVDTDPYRAREILRKARSAMHVKDIIALIGGTDSRNRRSSLAAQLGTYARRKEIFSKEGPNVFGLLDYGPIADSLDDEKNYSTLSDDMDPAGGPVEDDGWIVEPDIPF